MGKRVVILKVVSSREQAKDNKISLEVQHAACRKAAANYGWEIDLPTLTNQSRDIDESSESESNAHKNS